MRGWNRIHCRRRTELQINNLPRKIPAKSGRIRNPDATQKATSRRRVTSREGWLKFAKPSLRKMEEKYVLTSKRVEGEVEHNTGRFAEIQTVGRNREECSARDQSKYTAVT
jgi:hypothetical protein